MAANLSKIEGDVRRQMIVSAALDLAETVGFQQVTSEAVARRVACSDALVRQHFGTAALQTAMMTEAVRTIRLTVIAQGLAVSHPVALDAPLGLRQAAAAALVGV